MSCSKVESVTVDGGLVTVREFYTGHSEHNLRWSLEKLINFLISFGLVDAKLADRKRELLHYADFWFFYAQDWRDIWRFLESEDDIP